MSRPERLGQFGHAVPGLGLSGAVGVGRDAHDMRGRRVIPVTGEAFPQLSAFVLAQQRELVAGLGIGAQLVGAIDDQQGVPGLPWETPYRVSVQGPEEIGPVAQDETRREQHQDHRSRGDLHDRFLGRAVRVRLEAGSIHQGEALPAVLGDDRARRRRADGEILRGVPPGLPVQARDQRGLPAVIVAADDDARMTVTS